MTGNEGEVVGDGMTAQTPPRMCLGERAEELTEGRRLASETTAEHLLCPFRSLLMGNGRGHPPTWPYETATDSNA